MFDRESGGIGNAGLLETALIRVFQIAAGTSALWSHRGFGLLCRVLGRLVPPRNVTMRLNDDARFAFPFADPYWSILLNRASRYKDDIEALFNACRDVPYTFIDCGANFGYWSVLISSRRFGAQRVIAIEPSSSSFGLLSHNAAINRIGFECLKIAVAETSGVARLSGRKHESMTIAGPPDLDGETVSVIALDSLIETGQIAPGERTILKLDVEALEIAALKGASRLLRGDCAVICEEHGQDRNHSVSRHILQNTTLKLFCFDPAARRFIELTDVSPLDRIKRFRNCGYNVIATSSAFWEQRLRAA